jgi:hypothetical protein
MDFIVGLSLTTRRHNLIFMVVDNLIKSTHFILVRMTYQAPNIVLDLDQVLENLGHVWPLLGLRPAG